jgi:hypothetical protein
VSTAVLPVIAPEEVPPDDEPLVVHYVCTNCYPPGTDPVISVCGQALFGGPSPMEVVQEAIPCPMCLLELEDTGGSCRACGHWVTATP